MMSGISRRKFIGVALTHVGLASAVGCGTVLHPERRGQPAGRLDWKVVALDAAGLLLFFVPGVIAFAVDFSNGTIYLPPEGVSYDAAIRETPLVTFSVPKKELTLQKLEHVISEHQHRDIHLDPGTYETVQLASVDEFWTEVERHEGRRENS